MTQQSGQYDEKKHKRDASGRYVAKYDGEAGRQRAIRASEASAYILGTGPRPTWTSEAPSKGGSKRGASRSASRRAGRASPRAGRASSRDSSARDALKAEKDALRARKAARRADEAQEDQDLLDRQGEEDRALSEDVARMVQDGMDPLRAEALAAEKAQYRSRVRKREAAARKAARKKADAEEKRQAAELSARGRG
jgi:hypothetical protein